MNLLVSVTSRATLLLVALALFFAGGAAHQSSDAAGRGGFIALTGAEARSYVPPNNTRQSKSFPLERYGLTYERYEQYLGPARVEGAQTTVLRDGSGAPAAVIGAHFPDISVRSAVRLPEAAARATAEREFGVASFRRGELMIDPENGRYFYRVESRRFGERWVHLIDADNGRTLRSYDAIAHDHGTGVKGDTKSMRGPDGGASTTDDLTTFHGVAGHGPSGAHWDLFSTDVRQFTFDFRNTPSQIYYATDLDNHWTLVTADGEYPGQPAQVDAQYYANTADDYFLGVHGLDWIADCGYATMQSVVHHRHDYDNAFWDGTYVVYGDGAPNDTTAFSGGLDIVAHEHGHGVTECMSNLEYVNQSGALNESFSDVIGNSAEFFAGEPLSSNCVLATGQSACADWWVAEDIDLTADAVPGFRNMADPEEEFSNTLGANHPDHFSEFVVASLDNGGVHINSAIPNHAYYLLVNGGLNASCAAPSTRNAAHCSDSDAQDNNLVVDGIGLADAEKVFFLGFSGLPANATFCQAREATETAVTTLFGATSMERRSTTDAWVAVGLTDAACGIANTPPVATGAAAYALEDVPVGVTLAGSDTGTCELTILIVAPPSNGTLSALGNQPCTSGSPLTDSALATYTPGPGFTGADSFTYRTHDGSWYSSPATVSIQVFLDDADDDNDLAPDSVEVACAGQALHPLLRPERVDGPFAAADDDGDTLVDEALPPGAANQDCDGDGYKGGAETHVVSYLGQTTGDQKTCREYDASFPNPGSHVRPSLRWPADIASSAFSLNKVNVQDIASFTNPVRYMNTDTGTHASDVRFDLVPGTTFGADINIADLAAITAGPSAFPPMLAGTRAFGGPECPWAE
jgi:Zn-dependent metalloprotease